jgi:hypothetical protein
MSEFATYWAQCPACAAIVPVREAPPASGIVCPRCKYLLGADVLAQYSEAVRDYCSDAAEAARVSRLVRRVARSGDAARVVVVPGPAAPRQLGATPPVVARGKPNYAGSRLRVEVGRDWLLAACDLAGDALREVALDYVQDELARRGLAT